MPLTANLRRSKQKAVRATSNFASLVFLAASLPLVAFPVHWQVKAAQPHPAQKSAPPPNRSNFAPAPSGQAHSTPGFNGNGMPNPTLTGPATNPSFQVKGPGPHRGDWLRKYFALPQSQQEQKLRQDPAFQNLSPDKQQHLLDRLRQFNSNPPEKKQQILNRMENYEHMTPEQQQNAQNLFQRYRGLPEDQRTKVSTAYRRLRGMPPEQRSQLMNSDEFRNNYTEEERDLLRGMTELNVGPSHPE